MPRFTYVFSAVWFGFLFIFDTAWTIELIRGQVKPVGDASNWLSFMPYLMIVFGYALLRFGLWLSSRTESKLLEFVIKTVDGRTVDTF